MKKTFRVYNKIRLVTVFSIIAFLLSPNVFASSDLVNPIQPSIFKKVALDVPNNDTALDTANTLKVLNIKSALPQISIVDFISIYNDFIFRSIFNMQATALSAVASANASLSEISSDITIPKIPASTTDLAAAAFTSNFSSSLDTYYNYIAAYNNFIENKSFAFIRDTAIALYKTNMTVAEIGSDLTLPKINFVPKIASIFSATYDNYTSALADIFYSGGSPVTDTGSIHAKDELCINSTCVTEAQLKELLQKANTSNNN